MGRTIVQILMNGHCKIRSSRSDIGIIKYGDRSRKRSKMRTGLPGPIRAHNWQICLSERTNREHACQW
jgi:hypothetical protein